MQIINCNAKVRKTTFMVIYKTEDRSIEKNTVKSHTNLFFPIYYIHESGSWTNMRHD